MSQIQIMASKRQQNTGNEPRINRNNTTKVSLVYPGGGGEGVRTPPPKKKNHKNIEFPSNIDPDPLIITKLASQHSIVGHYQRLAGGPMMAHF